MVRAADAGEGFYQHASEHKDQSVIRTADANL
jgi:hypothetical protein